jgi:epsin
VYANAFHILRWLPRGCNVGLEGNVSETVKRVVAEEGRLQNVLDEASYLKRQHQMPERH